MFRNPDVIIMILNMLQVRDDEAVDTHEMSQDNKGYDHTQLNSTPPICNT